MNTAKLITLGLLRGSGAAFSPLDIAGLALWLDASDSTTLFQASDGTTPAVSDGDVVGYWGDKSPAGNHFTQATTANKPLLKLAIKNASNVIRWDATNDALVKTFVAPLTQPCVLWWAAQKGTPGAYFFDGPDAADRVYSFSTQPVIFAGTGLSAAGVTTTNWNIYTFILNGGSSILRANGAQVAAGNVGANPLKGMTLGARYSLESSLGGDISECIAASGLPSAATITDVETYMNTKWAVY